MTEKIIIAGSGGQGIMLLGKVLATAAMKENKFVTWLPAYGAEVRGGTANCMVIISDSEIGSPYISKADTLLALNEPSLEKFIGRLKSGGSLLINSSLAKGFSDKKFKIWQYPFTDIAIKIGNIKTANMVALGCLINAKKPVKIESVKGAFLDFAPNKPELVEINEKALLEGAKL